MDLRIIEPMRSPGDRELAERASHDPEAFGALYDRYFVANAPSNAICRKVGFTPIEVCDVEYPPGHIVRCNDWRLDLA